MRNRPIDQARPVLLQARDRAILASVHRHRWLRSEHVHALHFAEAGIRATRSRLRRLFLAGYLDREFLPLQAKNAPHPTVCPPSALYCLARRGAEVVADALGRDIRQVPHTRGANRRGFGTMLHNLVVTDFLVSLEAATTNSFHSGVHEGALWERLRKGEARPRLFVVPDGAFELDGSDGRRVTFYLEVVRADPKGGRRTLMTKLNRYTELNRIGFFKETWGDEHLRAVIILTPTPARAESLRKLAGANLAHGRQLFWFGSYEAEDELGRTRSTLTPGAILTPRFLDLDGRLHSLAEAFTPNSDNHEGEDQPSEGTRAGRGAPRPR